MSETVDWGTVQGIAIGVGVIMLLLAPIFWWLYDTDRAMKWGDQFRDVPLLIFILIPNAVRLMIKHDWLWLVIDLATIGVIVWGIYRSYRPKPDNSLG